MIILTVEEIIELHEKIVSKTGGSLGLRDKGLLESAVFSVAGGFEDIEVYPSVAEKAARFAYAIINNHAFIDGNKRIGVLVMLLTLFLNEIKMQYSQQELINLGLGIADKTLSQEAVFSWINNHKL